MKAMKIRRGGARSCSRRSRGISERDRALMWASRKPGVSGTPGDSHLAGLARGRPGVGAHFAGPVPGIEPHCQGPGSLSFVRGLNVVLPP